MSDEMVLESTETAPTSPNEDGRLDHSGETAPAAPATTEEPAPAQPAAPANETPAPSVAEEVATPEDDEDRYSMAAFGQLQQLQRDTVVDGMVMRVDREGVLVDVGAKSEGIIRLNELSREAGPNVNPESIVQVGDKIRVYVLEPENQEGIPVLSKKRADFEQAWVKVQAAKESGETITAMVQERVKGGLVVDLGIRGFVPASHVGNGSLKTNLDKYVGQSIPLKVIEVDKERRKVVLSNKLAVVEERESRSQETKLSLAPNQTRRGTVRRLTNYGAFIDLGGIDGLLHISEMSWTRINDPKEVLREGQELDVLILKMDLENNRVSLGLRQILPDPWEDIKKKYNEGDTIVGTITRIVPFGAFVQVDGVEGIIPQSELPRSRPGKGAPPLNANEEVTVKLISLRPEERKMTLSLRALQPPEERDAPLPPREPREPAAGGGTTGTAATGGRDRDNKRGRNDRGDDREDFRNFSGGGQDMRFNQLGEAFAAAKRNERKKHRRDSVEEDGFEDLGEIDEIEETEETSAEETSTEATSTEETPTEGTPTGEASTEETDETKE
jgi:predicted RNA-binding protein with RPS1 domain